MSNGFIGCLQSFNIIGCYSVKVNSFDVERKLEYMINLKIRRKRLR
ncbi:hypothetical protein LCDVSa114R [Lymphocystis disease virus 3]|uniref:Uncharacterized protein n=1 Tax=Lymphocystis disease virus 3 TaxID=2560566 RepID=A0A1B2RW27_9VIRU|nr:hypothetical protein BZK12_gp114 [Lymphocystis disease virus Sa]AOC55198.1 hypothetical protein LCDVSa114R [Lymphocystis disease virus 3]